MLINDPSSIVADALEGFCEAHRDLVRLVGEPPVVVRRDAPVASKVALVSGGGSGHEPLHAGFVGSGMLDAACPGEIFTSPGAEQIATATRAVDGGAGVLYVVKNYQGDVLNFKLAAEIVLDDGVEVETVLVNDDVAVPEPEQRRGVGATVVVEKIAGALAAEGASLPAVASVARRVNERARSFGIALSSCVTPAAGRPTFPLGEGEIEVGVGIHGERGRSTGRLRPRRELIQEMVAAVVPELESPCERVLALVTGLGATPLIELYGAFRDLTLELRSQGTCVSRSLVGNYVTSLNMAGIGITLVALDDELERLWDAPVHTAALRWGAER
jgi:dihydroxyacetone kinase-like protein